MYDLLQFFFIVFVWGFLSALATIVCVAPLAFAWVRFVDYVEKRTR